MENTTVKSLPINVRWNNFVQAEVGDHDQWGWLPESLERFKGIHGNVIDKVLHEKTQPNQTVYTVDTVKSLQNQVGLNFAVVKIDGNGQSKNTVETVTALDVLNLKEEILREGIWSYKYAQ